MSAVVIIKKLSRYHQLPHLGVEHAPRVSAIQHLVPVLLETDLVESVADVGHRHVRERSGVTLRPRQHAHLWEERDTGGERYGTRVLMTVQDMTRDTIRETTQYLLWREGKVFTMTRCDTGRYGIMRSTEPRERNGKRNRRHDTAGGSLSSSTRLASLETCRPTKWQRQRQTRNGEP